MAFGLYGRALPENTEINHTEGCISDSSLRVAPWLDTASCSIIGTGMHEPRGRIYCHG